MRALPKDNSTWVIITVVSLLIWYWAEGETRLEGEQLTARIEFVVPDPARLEVLPAEQTVTLLVGGSRNAMRLARERLQNPVQIDVSREEHRVAPLDLREALRSHQDLRGIGLAIDSVSPGTTLLSVQERVTLLARVRPVLQGLDREDETVEPPQVRLTLPQSLRAALPTDVTVEAVPDRERLERLQPGQKHTLDNVQLRLPSAIADGKRVRVEPPLVSVTFTIRSHIKELVLAAPVRVQIAGPPEDAEYEVACEPRQLAGVTISGHEDLVARVETGEVVIVALVHLKSSEKEAQVKSKPVTAFVALLPDGSATIVDAWVGAERQRRPVIELSIKVR